MTGSEETDATFLLLRTLTKDVKGSADALKAADGVQSPDRIKFAEQKDRQSHQLAPAAGRH
jgi:hypothetical protein